MKPFRSIMKTAVGLAMAAALILPTAVRAEESRPIPAISISVGKGQSTPEYEAGQTEQALELNLENQGSADAKNVKVTPILDNADTWPFDIANMNNECQVGDIPAGQNVSAKWEGLAVRSDVETKSYRLSFQITWDDGTNQYETSKYVFVKTKAKPQEQETEPEQTPAPHDTSQPEQASGEEELMMAGGEILNSDPVITGGGGETADSGNHPVPRVIVTGFSTDPQAVNAGSDFTLIVHLKNTSARTAVSNMLFDLQAPSSGTEAAAEAPAFLPSSGSSSIYLDSIPAGETRDISIALNARADLVQKPYSIAMSMKYEDASATQYESSSSLAIPVKQAARFEFSDLEIAPETIAVGEEANITCSLYNTGRIKLYNVKAKFQGDGIDSKEVFVGNVDSGATGSIDGIVTATKEMSGDKKCKMVVSYEDEAGKTSTVEKEFALEITPEQTPVDMSQIAEMPEEKGFPVLPAIIGAVILAAAIIIVIIIRRRKKKLKSVEEEDLLDEVDRFTEDE